MLVGDIALPLGDKPDTLSIRKLGISHVSGYTIGLTGCSGLLLSPDLTQFMNERNTKSAVDTMWQ